MLNNALSKIMSSTYSCPVCNDDVPVGEKEYTVYCPSCEERLLVDRDAEFEAGVWHDLTKLSRYYPQKDGNGE
jgi:uncharacterized Zn finger protein (UPF0148 family)